MLSTARQKSAAPTRKLSVGAVLAPVVALNAEPVVTEVWPQVAPAILSGSAMTTFVAAMVGSAVAMMVAWWVPDAPNLPNQ